MDLESFIEEEVTRLGYELVDFRVSGPRQGKTLLVMIDRPEGVCIKDCQLISGEIMDSLENKEIDLGNYRLEVSSPGLNRPLKKIKDFERFCGKKVHVKTRHERGNRRNYRGLLDRVEERNIYVVVEGCEFCIPFDEILKAHLIYEWDQSRSVPKNR